MFNVQAGPAFILGLFLAVSGVGLYFLRSVRPELSRDYDIIFAAVGLLCGFILMTQGWRLDPLLTFGQFMLTASTFFFAVESVRLRKVTTEQAKRNTPTVDRNRPVSQTRVYREPEYENDRSIRDGYNNVYEGVAPNYDSPQLRGYEDPQPRPRARREEEPRRRNPRSRSDRFDRPPYNVAETPRPRRPRNAPRPSRDDYAAPRPRQDDWDEPGYTNAPPTRPERPTRPTREDRTSRPPRRRPPVADFEPSQRFKDEDLGRSYDADLGTSYEEDADYNNPPNETAYTSDRDEVTTDYVDYQPMSDLGTSYEDDNYDDSYDRDNRDNPPIRDDSDWDEPDRRI